MTILTKNSVYRLSTENGLFVLQKMVARHPSPCMDNGRIVRAPTVVLTLGAPTGDVRRGHKDRLLQDEFRGEY